MSQDPQSPASAAKNDPVPLTAEEAAAREAARRAALPEIARRALEEADARRAKQAAATQLCWHVGRDGPEPVRYGDWEKKGLAIDF